MTLTQFLLARIAETEDAAHYCLDLAAKYYPAEDGFAVKWDWSMHTSNVSGGYGSQFMRLEGFSPARVLAECEAKRRIVNSFAASTEPLTARTAEMAVVRMVLKLLALPDADHPDYREEWRL